MENWKWRIEELNNWKMEKITPYTTTLNYSGSILDWQFKYIPDSKYEANNTQIRDEYGLYGTRLGGIFTPDEVIYYGGGKGTSPSNLGKPITYWWDAYGTGSGDLHYWSLVTGSDGSHNTNYYEKKIIYYQVMLKVLILV